MSKRWVIPSEHRVIRAHSSNKVLCLQLLTNGISRKNEKFLPSHPVLPETHPSNDTYASKDFQERVRSLQEAFLRGYTYNPTRKSKNRSKARLTRFGAFPCFRMFWMFRCNWTLTFKPVSGEEKMTNRNEL